MADCANLEVGSCLYLVQFSQDCLGRKGGLLGSAICFGGVVSGIPQRSLRRDGGFLCHVICSGSTLGRDPGRGLGLLFGVKRLGPGLGCGLYRLKGFIPCSE